VTYQHKIAGGRKIKRGFTLVELVVTIAIIVTLMALLVPSIHKYYLQALCTTCQVNVGNIAEACINYATDSILHRDTYAGALPSAGPTTSNWADIDYDPAATSNGNACGLWLLVLYDYATPEMFFCPEAGSRRGFKKAEIGDDSFTYNSTTGVSTLSYSYLSMVGNYVPEDPEIDPLPFCDATTVGGRFEYSTKLAIVADQNPRCNDENNLPTYNDNTLPLPENLGINSDNHANAGQNVARMDMSAEWTISVEGSYDDDIHAAKEQEDDDDATRSNLDDSFLLP
jgi:prepilin-type N-terminal cleavage/methylation domain-containing protein